MSQLIYLNVENNFITSTQINYVLNLISQSYYAGLVDSVTFLYTEFIVIPPAIECFLKGTHILTVKNGYKKIEQLVKGELLFTADHRVVPIREIDCFEVNNQAENMPVKIPKNFYDENVPFIDTFVSQNHAVYNYPTKCFKKARDISKVVSLPEKQITYYHVQLPNYETDQLFVNGVVMESWKKEDTLVSKQIQSLFTEKLSNVGVLNYHLQVLRKHS